MEMDPLFLVYKNTVYGLSVPICMLAVQYRQVTLYISRDKRYVCGRHNANVVQTRTGHPKTVDNGVHAFLLNFQSP